MKTKLLRKVWLDARDCWNSVTKISECGGKICGIGYTGENGDVLDGMMRKPFSFSWSKERKERFIREFVHRFWKIRKETYYAKYRKEQTNG